MLLSVWVVCGNLRNFSELARSGDANHHILNFQPRHPLLNRFYSTTDHASFIRPNIPGSTCRMTPEMRIATVQHKQPQLRTHPSTHSIIALHDYHSDLLTDSSTDDYAGESSSPISNEATKNTAPLRLHIPASAREFVQSEATIPRRATIRHITHAGRPPSPMQSNDVRILTADELAMSLDSSSPTPNINDSEYLQFALDQLTRNDHIRSAATSSDGSSDSAERVFAGTGTAGDFTSDYSDPFQSRRARRAAAAAAQSHVALPESEGKKFWFVYKPAPF